MSISPVNESKNSVTPTNESKTGQDITIDEMVIDIDDSGGTIDSPGVVATNESKNNVSVTNEAKT